MADRRLMEKAKIQHIQTPLWPITPHSGSAFTSLI